MKKVKKEIYVHQQVAANSNLNTEDGVEESDLKMVKTKKSKKLKTNKAKIGQSKDLENTLTGILKEQR